MSVSKLEPDSFMKWLQNSSFKGRKWPPRAAFSQYIQNIYQEIQNAGILKVIEYQTDVINISKANNRFELHLENGHIIKAREVVMCLGSINTNNFSSISHHDGFVRHHSDHLIY